MFCRTSKAKHFENVKVQLTIVIPGRAMYLNNFSPNRPRAAWSTHWPSTATGDSLGWTSWKASQSLFCAAFPHGSTTRDIVKHESMGWQMGWKRWEATVWNFLFGRFENFRKDTRNSSFNLQTEVVKNFKRISPSKKRKYSGIVLTKWWNQKNTKTACFWIFTWGIRRSFAIALSPGASVAGPKHLLRSS